MFMKKVLFLTSVILILSSICECQIINTIAGGGSSGLGDGGPATAAIIVFPWGSSFDKQGNFYFADGGDHRVRKIDTFGMIYTVAGTGVAGYNGDNIQATAAKLNTPEAVAIDSGGNVYVADNANNRIRRIDRLSGLITTVAGTGVAGFGGDGSLATSALLHTLADLCFDKVGNLYIADYGNNRVRKINLYGVITTVAGDGSLGTAGDGGMATSAQFMTVSGIGVDNIGNIFVADNSGGRVRRVDTNGMINTIAGTGTYTYSGDGIPATSANLAPEKIALDRFNQIFIVDNPNNRVRMVDTFGIIHTVGGNGIAGYSGDGGLATNAKLNNDGGIALDYCGNIYISEVGNSRIRKIEFNPSCYIFSLKNDQNELSDISLFPNPAVNEIFISNTHSINELVVTDIVGNAIFHCYNVKRRVIKLNVSKFMSGIYILEIIEDGGIKHVTRFLKN